MMNPYKNALNYYNLYYMLTYQENTCSAFNGHTHTRRVRTISQDELLEGLTVTDKI